MITYNLISDGIKKYSYKSELNRNTLVYNSDFTYNYKWVIKYKSLVYSYTDKFLNLNLYTENLEITKNNLVKNVSLSGLEFCSIKKKKYWFPLIIGLTIFGWGLIGLINFVLTPILGLSMTMSGFLMLYWGYVGSNVLILHTKHKTEISYFIENKVDELQFVVKLINKQIALKPS